MLNMCNLTTKRWKTSVSSQQKASGTGEPSDHNWRRNQKRGWGVNGTHTTVPSCFNWIDATSVLHALLQL